jgi:HrpA-like RNA helicase
VRKVQGFHLSIKKCFRSLRGLYKILRMAGRGIGRNAPTSGPVSSHTVDETLRINFTRQLLKLREDEVDEVVFPSTLNNIERKFLHKLAGELGLHSKSHGKGDDRKITVSKKEGNGVGNDVESIKFFNVHNRTASLLKKAFPDPQNAISSLNITSLSGAGKNFERTAASSAAADAAEIAITYSQAQAAMKMHPSYKAIQAKREQLPAFAFKEEVCKLVRENQVVLVSGETGCGKTTQVPQYLLEDPVTGPTCRIVVTQPRRISAVSVAERIASERCEVLGNSIGYNIRLESEKSKSTQVLFVTPGVLLRKLQTDPTLEEFTHIVIDEAHERDRFTEFLIIVLRDICLRRKSMKLILMSATMHTNKLSSYFGGVPQVHLGGSVFPVQEFFLEDVLKVSDYLANAPVFDAKGTALDKMNSFAASRSEYHCAQCTSGPFRSPEELGQHAALCFTVAPAEQRARLKKKKSTNLTELVNSLQRILNTEVSNTISSSSSIAKKTGGSADKSKAVNFDAPEGPQNLEEEGSEGPDSEWDSDDEMEGEHDGTASKDVTEQHKQDAHVAQIDAPLPEDNVLLKQYQYQFDDTQVDLDLILALLRYIFKSEFAKDGSVLVFMPGWDDISRMSRLLQSQPDFGGDSRYRILQLHSGIPRKDQNLVFLPLGKGEHKIILSTNIAETSITIDDVAVVIDAGRLKEKVYDPHVKLAYLKSEWISQASARQRKGRAGRTRSGVCFHLFSRRRHNSLPAFQDSELLRMPLEEIVLQAKILNVAPGAGDAHDGVLSFLSKAMDPPHVLSIINAVRLLQSINCLDNNEQITTMGRAISKLPMDPRLGRMIVIGCILGCGPAILATAAAMGYRDPFIMPTSEQQRAACNRLKMQLCRGFPSDQVGLYRALEGFSMAWNSYGANKAYSFCDQNFLSRSTMLYLRDLVQQLGGTVKEVGLEVHQAYFTRNNGNMELLMSTIGMGLYPDVGIRAIGSNAFKTEKGLKARVHAGSVNAKGRGAFATAAKADLEVIGYQDLVALTNPGGERQAIGGATLAMLSTTPISMFSLLLSCGALTEVKLDSGDETPISPDDVVLSIDDWIKIKMSRESAAQIHVCRNVLISALDHFVNNPGAPLAQPLKVAVDAVVQCLTLEQQQTTPILNAADVQDNYFRSQQANEQSLRNVDSKGSGAGKMKYFGGDAHKAKYKV